MRLLPLGLLGALALAACSASGRSPEAPATAPAATSPVQAVAETVTLRSTQGLIIAELAYNSAATAAEKAAEVGLVRPGTPLGTLVRNLNRRASSALETARRARTAAEQAAAVAQAMTAIGDLRGVTPAVKEK